MYKDKWLRICGRLAADDTFEAKKSMLDAYPSLRRMYSENDNTIAHFEKAVATLYSFTDAPEVVEI